MADYIIAGVVLLLIGAAVVYIVREKKRGVKCIGCPNGGCSQNNAVSGCGGCGGNCSSCHSESEN